jgi:hypothetical protein
MPKPDRSKVIRRYLRKESVDKINQNFTATFIFRTYQGERLVQEETEPLRMSYYTYPHLRALFLLTGLEKLSKSTVHLRELRWITKRSR